MAESEPGGVVDRIRLRALEARDLPILFQLQFDPESNRMAVIKPRDEKTFFTAWTGFLSDPSVTIRVIALDGVVVGNVSAFKIPGATEAEPKRDAVGYWIAREHWGKGIATRALTLFLKEVTIRPLYARVARTNTASLRVLNKCGFKVVGYYWQEETDRFPACEETLLVLS